MAKIIICVYFALFFLLAGAGLYQGWRDRNQDFSDYENWLDALLANE